MDVNPFLVKIQEHNCFIAVFLLKEGSVIYVSEARKRLQTKSLNYRVVGHYVSHSRDYDKCNEKCRNVIGGKTTLS